MPQRMDIENIRKMVADGRNATDIGAVYGVTKRKVQEFVIRHDLGPWKKKTNYKGRSRPIPDGFAEIAPTMTANALAARFGSAVETINKWCAATGVSALPRPEPIKAPDNIFEMLETMTHTDIAAEIGVGRNTVARMARAAGFVRHKPEPKPRPAQKSNAFFPRTPKVLIPKDCYQRDMSLLGQAVDHLRSLGPVYRCNDRGRADISGKMWRRGNSNPLTDEEIIERAVAKGFEYRTI